ncbi:MAG: hypothetical protein HZA88_21585 [Verrucomicrobia bacterium]|nr:hypothetical protein [Verrucomicrobiota bacterium]
MNPFRSTTPGDYESALLETLIYMAIVVLGGGWLIWVWKSRGAGKNHYVYASVAIALAAFLPVEQLLGPWLLAQQVYRLTRVTHYARYVCSGAAVLLALMGFIRIYFPGHHRTVSGHLAGAIGLVLGALVGIFTYTQQLWKIESPPHVREVPDNPAARGGRYFIDQQWKFGFIVPAREWLEDLPAVRPKDTVAVLNQHTLRAQTRVYVERGMPSLLALRDRCLADVRALNPDVVVEKEEKTTINKLEAMRLEARATQDGTERRYCCTVYISKENECAYRVISWAPAAVYPQVQSDIEFIHKTFQTLVRREK